MHHVSSASQQSPRLDRFLVGFLIALIGGLEDEDDEASHEYDRGRRRLNDRSSWLNNNISTSFLCLSLQRPTPPRSLCKLSKPHLSLYLIVRDRWLEPRMRMPVFPLGICACLWALYRAKVTIQGCFCHLTFKSNEASLCWDRNAINLFAKAHLDFDILSYMSSAASEHFKRAIESANMPWNTNLNTLNRFCEGTHHSSISRYNLPAALQILLIFSGVFIAGHCKYNQC